MEENLLFIFEEKYPFLYDLQVRGVPVYTSFRDGVLQRLRDGKVAELPISDTANKVSIRRILGSFFKQRKYKKKKTLIFTSTVYRRDNGRNLAAEYLLEKYPDGAIFEWQSGNPVYDKAYFTDVNKDRYCPLDYFSVKLKIYKIFHKKEYARLCEEGLAKIKPLFENAQPQTEGERLAIEYLLAELPAAYATTVIYQKLFARYFKKFKNLEYAIDFWGGARENIIPVLRNNPKSVELQHGIITGHHPGYVYPRFVGENTSPFFKRKILVYGDKTKRILCENSIFPCENVEVIGNPRVQTYKKVFGEKQAERKLILFASQPYEGDGVGKEYYKTVVGYLKTVADVLKTDGRWAGYRLAVKLHPRESNAAVQAYKELGDI
ncbi:MAG: hypothetical protein IJF64_01935, partial [Clostridia bacterium]|nr:hypothetical protein [Clostridia bacterium]